MAISNKYDNMKKIKKNARNEKMIIKKKQKNKIEK